MLSIGFHFIQKHDIFCAPFAPDGHMGQQKCLQCSFHLWYNMDEMGSSTEERKKKVLVDKSIFALLFRITPEVDQIELHKSICLTFSDDCLYAAI